MKNTSGCGILVSSDEVESNSVSAVVRLSFIFSLDVDRGVNSNKGRIFTVGFSGSSDRSVSLKNLLLKSGS